MQRIHLWLAAACMTGFAAAFTVDFDAMLPPPADYLNAYERQAGVVPWRAAPDGGAWRVITLGGDAHIFEYRSLGAAPQRTADTAHGCLAGLLSRLDNQDAAGPVQARTGDPAACQAGPFRQAASGRNPNPLADPQDRHRGSKTCSLSSARRWQC